MCEDEEGCFCFLVEVLLLDCLSCIVNLIEHLINALFLFIYALHNLHV